MDRSDEMDYIIIESLPLLKSLKLTFPSAKQISIKRLYSLEKLNFHSDMKLPTDLFDQLPKIEFFSNETFEFYKIEKSLIIYKLRKDDYNLDFSMKKFSDQIESIHITDSNIENTTKHFFDGFKQLKFLYLSHNNIELFDKSHYSGLINLEFLDLSNNRLKRLDENIFADLKSLKRLDLSNNQLENLDSKVFVGLEKLSYVNLSDNKLRQFDVGILVNLPRIEKIDLSRNEICISEAEMLKKSKIRFVF